MKPKAKAKAEREGRPELVVATKAAASGLAPPHGLPRMRSRSFSHSTTTTVTGAEVKAHAQPRHARRMSAASSLTLASGADTESAATTLAPAHPHPHPHLGHPHIAALSSMSAMKAWRLERDRAQGPRVSRGGRGCLAVDPRTLPMHLALRVQEIAACAEAMWAFVRARQRACEAEQEAAQAQAQGHAGGGRPRANSKTAAAAKAREVVRRARPRTKMEERMLALTRQDFDDLVDWFVLDMQDNARLGDAVREQPGWNFPRARIAPNERRKQFMKACKQWTLLQKKLSPKKDGESKATGQTSSQSHLQRPTDGGKGSSPSNEDTCGHGSGMRSDDESQNPPQRPRQPKQKSKPPKEEDPPPKLSPSERISRIMRVFIAWKA
ncbi:hypothetical protein EIP86_006484 [Pleurotus ostreatoroseus]|nr:hypothetical protein EIP86_006484 [Pleurotus ostreatoroseus]